MRDYAAVLAVIASLAAAAIALVGVRLQVRRQAREWLLNARLPAYIEFIEQVTGHAASLGEIVDAVSADVQDVARQILTRHPSTEAVELLVGVASGQVERHLVGATRASTRVGLLGPEPARIAADETMKGLRKLMVVGVVQQLERRLPDISKPLRDRGSTAELQAAMELYNSARARFPSIASAALGASS